VEDGKKVDNCLLEYAKLKSKRVDDLGVNVKYVEYSRRLARGTSLARVQDEAFMEYEDFCLTSDSHMDVVQVIRFKL
jgi:hypothetical protein